MKKILAGIICICMISLSGCYDAGDKLENGWTYVKYSRISTAAYKILKIEGHDYLVAVRGTDGISIIHSESCSCKAK